MVDVRMVEADQPTSTPEGVMRKSLGPVLLLLLAAVLSSCGSSARAGEITGSYTNAYDGYTIDVPLGWRVEPASVPGATANLYSYPETGTVEPGSTITKIEIYVDPLPGLRDALAFYPLAADVHVLRERMLEIDGHPALQQNLRTPGGANQMVSLVHDTKLITMLVYGDAQPVGATLASLELD
jgi:hypothetical protein